MELVKPGYYDAVPVDYKYVEIGKNASPAIEVYFEVEGQKVRWTGFLTEKTKKRTIESLIYMGFKGKDLSGFAYGTDSKMLDGLSPVSITVAHEDHNGKTYAKVRWINPVKSFNKIDPAGASKLKALNLEADILEAKQALGVEQKSLLDDIAF